MALRRHFSVLTTCGMMMATALAIPASRGAAQDANPAPALSYNIAGSLAAPAADAEADGTPTTTPPDVDRAAALDPAELECMAKVVMHEAGNQPRLGQIAVAQTLVNRMQSGRFAGSICGVANQPGQFFRTAAYSPPHNERWEMAVAVARDTMLGNNEQAAPGALFFHGVASKSAMRNRQRVATIGGHVFYR